LTTVGVCVACATPPVDKSALQPIYRLENQVPTRPRNRVKSKPYMEKVARGEI